MTNLVTHISETGSTHTEDLDAEQPFPSWVKINNGLGSYWDAPTPCPMDGHVYQWNEETLTWEKVNV